ncbi:TetR/AcrR family transcriptional regulator [Spongiibacter sp.]|uniref:TetR/AcrR family transcriptional regulator n=1 Tax=Spongiibacter sp. TaxID=2024860 RepID=UPI0035640393
MTTRRNTREKILEVAEQLFAKQGFAATSVSEIAARVGISSPGIYKHFNNKLAIYEEVCERLMAPIVETSTKLHAAADFLEIREQLRTLMSDLSAKPNIARLVQHATLAQDETLTLLSERWYRKLFAFLNDGINDPDVEWIHAPTAMAFHCMILGYVTLAPLHQSIFGIDPMEPKQLEAQLQLQNDMVDGFNRLLPFAKKN